MRSRAIQAFFLAICSAGFPPAGFAQSDPAAVFRQAIDARNRGDIGAMMALFTDDAVRVDGSCQPPCAGIASVRASFLKNIDEHFHANLTSVKGEGDTVTGTAEITSDVFRAQGIDKRKTSYTVKLRGGKIASWTSPLPPRTPTNTN